MENMYSLLFILMTLCHMSVTAPTSELLSSHHSLPVFFNPCDHVLCPHGSHCIAKDRQCLDETCPKLALCEATKPHPLFCGMPRDPGNCSTEFPSETRWYYTPHTANCESFLFSGCGGNENNYFSLGHCERSCVRREDCQLRPEAGPCRASFTRWYYDVFEGTCRKFIYGGCRGNDNNFPNEEQCIKKCFLTEFEDSRPRVVMMEEGDELDVPHMEVPEDVFRGIAEELTAIGEEEDPPSNI